MNDTSFDSDSEVFSTFQLKTLSPSDRKLRSNKRVSIQVDPNRSINAAGVSEKLLNQPGLENVKLYIEEIKSAYDSATSQNKETLEKLEELRRKLDEVTDAYERENLELKNSIRLSDYSHVKLSQEIKLLRRHLSYKDQDDSEVKQKLNETLQSYDELREEMEELEEENSRLKDSAILLKSYETRIEEYGEMIRVLIQDKNILEIRLEGLQKELQKQMAKNYDANGNTVELELCRAKIKQFEKRHEDVLKELEKVMKEKEKVENDVKQLKDTINNLEIDLKYFQDQVIDQVKLIEKQQGELKALEFENKNLSDSIMELNEHYQNKESTLLMNESVLKDKLNSIISDNNKYVKKMEREFHDERKQLLQKHEEEIETLKRKHQEDIDEIYKKEKEKVDTMKAQFNEQLDIIAIAATRRSEDKINDLKNQVKDYEAQVDTLTTQNKMVLEEKCKIENEHNDAKKIYTQTLQEKTNECSELSRTLSLARKEINNYEECFQQLKEENENYKIKIDTIFQPKINSLIEQNRVLENQYVEKYTLCGNLQKELEEKSREIEILKVQRSNTLQQASQNFEGQNSSQTLDQLLFELGEYKKYATELQESYNSLKINFDSQVKIISDGKIYTDYISKQLERKDTIINELEEKLNRVNRNVVPFVETQQVRNQDSTDNFSSIDNNKSIAVCKNCEKLAEDILTLDHKAQNLISQIEFMQSQINGLNIQANSYSDKIEQLEQQIEIYEEERLEHETTENEMKERIRKLESDNSEISREINCLKQQLCKVNQELILKDQELSRHHEQLLILEIEKEKLNREKLQHGLHDGNSSGDSMMSKEVYETILSDSEVLINDLRDFVDRVSVTLESLMSRPFPTLPEVDYPSMINIAKAVVQLIELIPSKETNDANINVTTNPHIEELNSKIRHLEDRLCENNQNWESFYKIEHDCRMSFEEKLKAAEEQINRLTMQLLEDKGFEEVQKVIGDSAVTVIPPELLSSVPIGIKMKISILAAKLSTKMLDNDALLRANNEIAHTNVLLQNRLDYYKEKLESIYGNLYINPLSETYALSEEKHIEKDEKEKFDASKDLIQDTSNSYGDVRMISNTESISSTEPYIDNCNIDQTLNCAIENECVEEDRTIGKKSGDSSLLQTNNVEVNYTFKFESKNSITVEEKLSDTDKCGEKDSLILNFVNATFLKKDEECNTDRTLVETIKDRKEKTLKILLPSEESSEKNSVDVSITYKDRKSNTNWTANETTDYGKDSNLNKIPDESINDSKKRTLKVISPLQESSSIEEKNESTTHGDVSDFNKCLNQQTNNTRSTNQTKKIVNKDHSNNVNINMEDEEKFKNKKFIDKKNLDNNGIYQNLVSKNNETMAIENKKSRTSIKDQIPPIPKGGSNKVVGNKTITTKKENLSNKEIFDPFEIPKLPQCSEDNIFEDIFEEDTEITLPITSTKKKSTSNVGNRKAVKKASIGNDIFTNFTLPDIISAPISTVPVGQKANLSSSNSKGAFVAPDKVSLNRDYKMPKHSPDVVVLRSETPIDFAPVEFKKEPPKSIFKPRALSKPKYTDKKI